MNQCFKDTIDIISKVSIIGGILFAALNYRNLVRTKRGEWLKDLFEKFYEVDNFKLVRKWIESGEIEKKINMDSIVTEDEENVTDYFNFFEFIATLNERKRLNDEDVLDMFDYYLRKMKILQNVWSGSIIRNIVLKS